MLPAPSTACVKVSSWPLPVGPLTTPLLTKLPLIVALPVAVRTLVASTDAALPSCAPFKRRQAAAVAEVRLAAENGRVAGNEDDRIAADVERAADARTASLVELAGCVELPMKRSPVAVTVPAPVTARLTSPAACKVAPAARVMPPPACGMPSGAASVPWATAIGPVETSVSAPGSVKPPDPLFVNPPVPLIVEFKSKAPPLIAKVALLAQRDRRVDRLRAAADRHGGRAAAAVERQAAIAERVAGIAEAQGLEAGIHAGQVDRGDRRPNR